MTKLYKTHISVAGEPFCHLKGKYRMELTKDELDDIWENKKTILNPFPSTYFCVHCRGKMRDIFNKFWVRDHNCNSYPTIRYPDSMYKECGICTNEGIKIFAWGQFRRFAD